MVEDVLLGEQENTAFGKKVKSEIYILSDG